MRKIVALFLLLAISTIPISAKEIAGIVKNGKSVILQNVSIYLKNNPSVSIFTNESGEFVLNLKEVKYLEQDIIIFSHVGYETKEYQIEELRSGVYHEIKLGENSIKLSDVTVFGRKLSRKERKNKKISIIKQFKEQAKIDFVFKDRTYKVVSDVEVIRDEKRVFYNKLIGEHKELIGVLENNRDSMSFTYSDMYNYMDSDIESGIKKMSDKFIDNNVVSKKRKENKRILDSTFYKTLLTDSIIFKEVLNIHKFFWLFNRDIDESIMELDDNIKRWEIIAGSEQTILRYKSKFRFLGLVKLRMSTDYIVDPNNYSLERIDEKISFEINIPFGYKLPPDGLMLLNVISANSEDKKKFKVRHLHADIAFKAVYKDVDSSKCVDEMNYNFDVLLIDTKKRNVKGESKGLVKVLSIKDN